jgi:hypothetical protein
MKNTLQNIFLKKGYFVIKSDLGDVQNTCVENFTANVGLQLNVGLCNGQPNILTTSINKEISLSRTHNFTKYIYPLFK